MPPVRPAIILSLRACTAGMSIDTAAPSMPVRPHSFAACAIFSACACSSNALVGMQPQIRQVPPSVFCFSTTATLRPNCAARMAATYPPVPAPITTTSYSLATISHCNSTSICLAMRLRPRGLARVKGTKVCLGSGAGGCRGIDLGLQLAVIELELPVHVSVICASWRAVRRACAHAMTATNRAAMAITVVALMHCPTCNFQTQLSTFNCQLSTYTPSDVSAPQDGARNRCSRRRP